MKIPMKTYTRDRNRELCLYFEDTVYINNDLFPEVKWEDKEPTEIGIQIVTKSLDSSQLPQH